MFQYLKMLILCQMFCKKLLVERKHNIKRLMKLSVSKILLLFLNWKLIFQFFFKDFMELHGKCQKEKTYTQSKNLFCRFVCHFYLRKGGSGMKYEVFRFKTYFVSVKININWHDAAQNLYFISAVLKISRRENLQ